MEKTWQGKSLAGGIDEIAEMLKRRAEYQDMMCCGKPMDFHPVEHHIYSDYFHCPECGVSIETEEFEAEFEQLSDAVAAVSDRHDEVVGYVVATDGDDDDIDFDNVGVAILDEDMEPIAEVEVGQDVWKDYDPSMEEVYHVEAYDEKVRMWYCGACDERFEDQSDAEECCSAETFEATPYSNWFGACLLPDGRCMETTMSDCRMLQGRFQGPGTSCGGYQRPLTMSSEGDPQAVWEQIWENWQDDWMFGEAQEDIVDKIAEAVVKNDPTLVIEDNYDWYLQLSPKAKHVLLSKPYLHPIIDADIERIAESWDDQFLSEYELWDRDANCGQYREVLQTLKNELDNQDEMATYQDFYEIAELELSKIDLSDWSVEKEAESQGNNAQGKGLVIAVTVGVMTGVMTTIVGTILSEMWLDRLREDPELHTTPDDLNGPE